MLKIRLQRVGRIHQPLYRLLLTDSKNSTKSGKFLEILGNFDSRDSDKTVLKDDRIKYWISQGVQVSDTVHNLLIDKNVITGKKINALPLKKPIKKDQPIEATPAPSVDLKPDSTNNTETVPETVESGDTNPTEAPMSTESPEVVAESPVA